MSPVQSASHVSGMHQMLAEGTEPQSLAAIDHIKPGLPRNLKLSIIDGVQNGTKEERQAALRLLRDFEVRDEEIGMASALEGIARARGQQLRASAKPERRRSKRSSTSRITSPRPKTRTKRRRAPTSPMR